MVRIIVNNHKSRVVGDLKVVLKLHRAMKIKSPGYFWSTAWRDRQWDGYIKYVTEAGNFSTGLLHQVTNQLKEWGVEFEIEDTRETFKEVRVVTQINGMELRGYQLESVYSFFNHRVAGVRFRRGILAEATNAGKNLITAAIFMGFSKNRKGIFLIDNKSIFEQAVKEFSELLPGEVGYINSDRVDTSKRITICMAQSLYSKARKDYKLKAWLNTLDIFVVDECDAVGSRNDTKWIAANCLNASVRLGLSGTPLHHKDRTRNQEVLAFFGPIIHTTTNKQLVDQGYSSKPTIRIIKGNTKVVVSGDYRAEYDLGIIRNRSRNKRVWKRAIKAVEKGPVVILIKYHKHIEKLLKVIPEKFQDKYRVESCHHKTANRKQIFSRFNRGKIDVLICSMIIRRGMNLKLMRTLINTSGGDSHSNTLQLLGRGLRKEEGVKEEIDIWDFYDEGEYLKKHSKHRIRYYKGEGFPVQELYK